jgi:two-component system, cell cycle sensor histidine kinase and response regulator CckA
VECEASIWQGACMSIYYDCNLTVGLLKATVAPTALHPGLYMATGLKSRKGFAKKYPQEPVGKLLQEHKTDLIAELAQTMANELNNVMMAVTGYAELELKKATSKERRSLEQVLDHATHATFLIHKLLDFSRPRSHSPQFVELDGVITQLGDLLRDLLAERAELSLHLDAQSETICIDQVELEQALFSLIIIARNAITAGAKLTLSTSIVDLDRKFIGTDSAEAGKYVAIALETRGGAHTPSAEYPGLNQNERINLSLAAIRGILEDSNGLARFSSEPDAPSYIHLYFPTSAGETISTPGPSFFRNPAVARTILVVEDDDAVRVPAAEFLMMEGFKVLQARTGSEALKVVQQSRSPLDVLVADIFMPKMNGLEVAAALLDEHPGLKVLYMSGDPSRTGLAGATSVAPHETLRKPFRLNALRDKIHDLLGE